MHMWCKHNYHVRRGYFHAKKVVSKNLIKIHSRDKKIHRWYHFKWLVLANAVCFIKINRTVRKNFLSVNFIQKCIFIHFYVFFQQQFKWEIRRFLGKDRKNFFVCLFCTLFRMCIAFDIWTLFVSFSAQKNFPSSLSGFFFYLWLKKVFLISFVCTLNYKRRLPFACISPGFLMNFQQLHRRRKGRSTLNWQWNLISLRWRALFCCYVQRGL